MDEQDITRGVDPAEDARNGEEPASEGPRGLVLDSLARLPAMAILDEAALAAALHVAPRTLRRLVDRWQIPPPARLGNRNLWYAGRVLAHIDAAMVRAEKDAERAARKWRENNA